ncbi:PTS glucose transporter subunit IIA [Alteromonas sp. 1_MG-2023]|uniref:PTS sugar transporter subunit IIA n=1 Tax=Alteromonas sp. 1_MG-2023 TaxID=3062669 RepID=UPI0026E2F4EB|nr:PTS glucose transporter subunit IIA [Alteromonas sp. 1_MG-2023]MDO6567432.1 PTS glucose transporter subunit IIA [Alteromonas sp. 1_MG-2023]
MVIEKQLTAPPEQFKKAIPIKAPASGQCVSLYQVNDDLIKVGAWGPGLALTTSSSKLISPFDATILKIDPLDYAMDIKSSFGLKCRIKYGLQTDGLHGAQFLTPLKQGDQIKAGAMLFSVNSAWLKQQGVENICIMTLLNAKALLGVLPTHQKFVDAGNDTFLTLYI